MLSQGNLELWIGKLDNKRWVFFFNHCILSFLNTFSFYDTSSLKNRNSNIHSFCRRETVSSKVRPETLACVSLCFLTQWHFYL